MTKDTNTGTEEIGVVVGRFQSPYIHNGYRYIFERVKKTHDRVFVFIGQTAPAIRGSFTDPLTFQMRARMIQKEYPSFEIYKIDDLGNAAKWSKMLDAQIHLLAGPGQKVKLYGSRDSFLTVYKGHYPTEEMPSFGGGVSATDIRRICGIKPLYTEEFMMGAVWLSQNQWEGPKTVVDMAAIDVEGRVLIARRETDPPDQWRFPGGFASNSDSFEDDAFRELQEETGLQGTRIEYVTSRLIDDTRFKNQREKIKSIFYAITQWNGEPKAADDLDGGEVKWVHLNKLGVLDMFPQHRWFLTELVNWWDKKQEIEAALKFYRNAKKKVS